MSSKLSLTSILTALALLAPGDAFAQAGSASIAGAVPDTTGAVLPGVVIEAASPSLIEKVRTVVSDGQGVYKVVDLRPGTYTVTFTLAGFSSVKRDGIELTANFTASVNAELRVGSLEETVTVSGQTPVVDVQNVVQQQVMTRDVIDALPTGKNFVDLGVLIPGMSTGSTQDVGGSAGDRSLGMSIHGGRTGDMEPQFDGMTFSNGFGRGGGLYGQFISNASVQEVSVEVSGMDAEHELSGVRVNMIPRDGGNTFNGVIFGDFSNYSLQSDNLSDDFRTRGLNSADSIDKLWDINPGLGGPIVKDRLWFYSSFRYWGSYIRIAGLNWAVDPTSVVFTPDPNRRALDDIWHWSQDLRLTGMINQRNRLSLFVNPQYSLFGSEYSANANIAKEAYGYSRHRPQYLVQTKWTSPVTNRVLLEAGMSLMAQDPRRYLQPGLSPNVSSITELRTNFTYRAPNGISSSPGSRRNNQYNYRASASYITGSHAFKAGVFLMHAWVNQTREINNAYNLQLLDGAPRAVQQWALPIRWRETLDRNLGIYVQDQWVVRHRLTLNLGVRADSLKVSIPSQHLDAGPFVGSRDFAPVKDVPNWWDVSPRVGAAYDLTGDGKTALKVNLGRYNVGVGTDFARPVNPVEASVNNVTRTWQDSNGDYIPNCDLANLELNGECGPIQNANFGRVGGATQYAPELSKGFGKRVYNWELSTSGQRELIPGTSATIAYFHRWYGNLTTTQNLAVTSADFDPYCVTAPVDPRLPGGGGNQICGFYDVNLLKFARFQNQIGLAENFGTQEDVYDGVDVTVQARLPKGVVVSGGTNTGRERTNNCYATNDLSLAVPGSAAGVVAPRIDASCDIRPPFQTQIKFLGVVPLPWWGLQASATLQSLPGAQITASYVVTNEQIRGSLLRNLSSGANGTVTVDLIPPGTQYEERWSQLDLRLTKAFRLGKRRIQGSMDLFNALNESAALALNTRYGSSAWLRPTKVLQGRLLKFGAQVYF